MESKPLPLSQQIFGIAKDEALKNECLTVNMEPFSVQVEGEVP